MIKEKATVWYDYEGCKWFTYFGDWDNDRQFSYSSYDEAYLVARYYNEYYKL